MRRTRLIPLAIGFVTVLGAAGGAFLGGYAPQWFGSALDEARAEVASLRLEVMAQEAVLEDVRARAERLEEQVLARERTVATLEQALGERGDLADRYTSLVAQHSTLQVEHQALQTSHDALVARADSLRVIRTPELPGDALLLDRSVRGVTYTTAVCSGSMEPNISCDDLLLLYEPSVSDLRVGDIIYFRRQAPNCSGPMDGRFMLHRITRVTAGSEGLRFQTKGDALAGPDSCPVPAEDVMFKLLTNVRNARVQE